MLLMIDNYDSFTYTLVQYFQALGQEVLVKRNDEITVSQVTNLNPDRIVISPGPCSPEQAGVSKEIILGFFKERPILGVCLGHQAIAEAFGADVVRAKNVMHGKTSQIHHQNTGIFQGIMNPLTVTRYHSLIVKQGSLPEYITETAWVDESEFGSAKDIMAIEMKDYPTFGVQFHPESILTEQGSKLLNNFLRY